MESKPFSIHSGKKRIITWVVIIALFVLVGSGAGMGIGWYLSQQALLLPAHITSQLKFTPHIPKQLPPGYALDISSTQVDKGVLVLYLKNTADQQIVFTEQPRPTNQNFDNFYLQNIANSERMENVVYESVLGELPAGGYMLSVLTDATWLLISTGAPNGKAALRHIAQHMTR